ncbi:putative dicarboxylate carrier protein [Marmoricola endophyticus]|uniref:Dicarboxylate carrier protein n=1 Tax=Marmoricola endophyticus TaxID=2040280 RepID=A0A917BEZ6_9ACTN|nr:SLC13 family permease [Marmoricola endophyticus]GGF40193.1 putative dicarboxylate carrier protein [Marmoricola endophyticus]
MSFPEVLSLVLLGVVLVFAIAQRINIGILALAAALPILALTGTSADTLYESFPGDLFVLIAGVSLLFAHLERSGALGRLVEVVYAAIGERRWLLPWAGFAIAAGMSTAGAFSTAPIAFLVPTIAAVSVRYKSSFLLSELAVIIGANSSGLSPLNPTGATVRTAADKFGVHYSTWGLWAVSFATAVVVVLVLQLIDRARRPSGRAYTVTPAPAEQPEAEGDRPPTPTYLWSTVVALVAFLVLVVAFKTDVGVTSMALGVLLQIAFRPDGRALLARVPWPSILLLCGLLTYLGLLQEIGTIDAIQDGLDHVGTGALLVILLSYLTVLLCCIESSTLGVLGLTVPLAATAFGNGPETFWVLAAVAVPAALMVMNPIHVAGTLVIANSALDEQDRLFRKLLGLAVTLAVIAPAVLVVPALITS